MTQKPTCLIVDDETDIRELLVMTLERMDIDTYGASNIEEAKSLLKQRQYALCLTDMQMPGGTGLDLVNYINEFHPGLPVAVITAHASAENAVSALKAGAFDYLSKPISLKQLRPVIEFALKLTSQANHSKENVLEMIGDSEPMTYVRTMIAKLARSQAPVYISGESGSGKELAAKLIHKNSSRVDGAFIAVNCGAIPENLMESEFFGYKKGAFTGASQDKEGMFQAASGGTLFLDEVADLPLPMQVKLLRAIQEKKIRMVGGTTEEAVDVRIISATHKNLSEMMDAGLFRQDLYYRLNVIQLKMPALRDRPNDIPLLANLLLTKLCASQKISIPQIDATTQAYISKLQFPGNVRELENMLERALAMSDGKTITIDDLGDENESNRFSGTKNSDIHPKSAFNSGQTKELNLSDYLEDIEKQAIVKALEKTNHNKTAAAKLLGVSFRTLRYRLSKLGLAKEGDADFDGDIENDESHRNSI
ncbi:sigma-54 dependent transcriptional regulator [Methylotenera sp.]|uniref:sigma-54-dependent transcriptional regulator n=1 Tax=Methylotenera sp. TaxID=2051956 RepID=UPI002719E398|nr:sigma-54 dependent transcriptional regulator [Methylotenera sp.]MDO9392515.1 sigma-54 dependent transcriptional regulator [Methylotenera sp.]MDP1523841.1 sigma-54 dependent transcriptional regulator [Methylotenera sp.]MDP2070231.1 sigma-54 dependent transcriptional regulator [Methylotenera sp.]MDP3007401.1 sigma-54 dependent transcriptional regulator [Methylotenera sp.]MDP3309056.1 sigma-54 dependent transcriptional regulator [Methylotenera sp.]